MNKFKKTRNIQKERYRYKNGCGKYESRLWTESEDELILDHSIPDSELSKIIFRSVGAIQSRRSKLKRNKKIRNSEK